MNYVVQLGMTPVEESRAWAFGMAVGFADWCAQSLHAADGRLVWFWSFRIVLFSHSCSVWWWFVLASA